MTRPQSPLVAVAGQELVLAVRSRWTQIFAVVFALLALAVAASGYVLSGGHGVQDFARTAVSLVQLILLLVPLTALLIGVMALLPERGASELLFSQPVSRWTILSGKLLGLFAALAGAQLVGFGASGLAIYSEAGSEGVGRFLLLIVGALVLTAVSLSVAALIASGDVSRRRSRAIAVALVVWFSGVVLFDVAALGLASLLRSGTASRVLVAAVIVNPVDAVRTAMLLGIEGVTAFGSASLAFLRITRGPVVAAFLLAASVALWTVVPLWLAGRRLSRADI
ncbi:MAG: ABC transporter permease [Vicinamibacterales bacterium]